MSRRLAALAALLVAAFALAAASATASPRMLVGIFDDAQLLYGDPQTAFADVARLKLGIVRVTLNWGGPLGVAARRPARPADPTDRAYRWELYDRAVQYANANGARVMLTIQGTPAWANGGAAPNVAPRNALDLQRFAFAAATRYSGATIGPDGRTIPAVRYWLAWNEPNNPVFLRAQYRRVAGAWRIQSAVDYAKICNAVYAGVHATFLAGEKVGCGATSPRGNNDPSSSRPSVSPAAFLRAAKAAGLARFDAWAHHPYYGSPSEEPGKEPPRGTRGQPPTAVTLGNIGTLIAEVTRLYGRKPLWITEYGYQTNPPDRQFGVSFALQAGYLTRSFALARANPRIELMIWFLLRDEGNLDRWQSGLYTAAGRRKPAYAALRNVAVRQPR